MNGRTGIDTDASDIAAGTSHILDEAQRDRVSRQGHYRDYARLALEKRGAGANDVNDIWIAADHLSSQGGDTSCVLFTPVALDRKVLSLDMPEAPKLGE